MSVPTACVRDKTTELKLARSKPIKSCDWAVLATDRAASTMDMSRRVSLKIPSPLFPLKHKAGLVSESICKWLGAALAVGFHLANMPPASPF